MPPGKSKKLIALPVHVLEVPDGVILKRGCTEVKITGPQAASAIKTVLSATSADGASIDDICSLFARSSAPRVKELIKELTTRNLLTPSNHSSGLNRLENHLDLFYWHFGETAERVVARFEKLHLFVLGVNYISRQLAVSLDACGYSNFQIIDHPQHRNPHFFDEAGKLRTQEWPDSLNRPQDWRDGQECELHGCVVATSDFGGQEVLRRWNKFCVEQNVHFMPVMLKNMIGYVGPLVVPKETACYECLVSRQRSHTTDLTFELAADKVASEEHRVIGFHPSMVTMLGDIAAFELTRFYIEPLPGRKPGRLLEVDLLAPRMMERTVLKVPRCPTCSPLHQKACTNLSKTVLNEQTFQ